jgi:hypothetical protein
VDLDQLKFVVVNVGLYFGSTLISISHGGAVAMYVHFVTKVGIM